MGRRFLEKKLLQNVVGKTHLSLIQKEMSSQNFGWYFHTDINNSEIDYIPSRVGFVHTFVRQNVSRSDYSSLIMPIVWAAIDATEEKLVQIIRVKANLTLNMNGEESITPHQDLEPNCDPSWNMWSAIFYVYNGDGDTIFYKDDEITETDRIKPSENSMVLFDSNIFHYGSLPRIDTNRKIINIVFATMPNK
jgi:hypothetical protein